MPRHLISDTHEWINEIHKRKGFCKWCTETCKSHFLLTYMEYCNARINDNGDLSGLEESIGAVRKENIIE